MKRFLLRILKNMGPTWGFGKPFVYSASPYRGLSEKKALSFALNNATDRVLSVVRQVTELEARENSTPVRKRVAVQAPASSGPVVHQSSSMTAPSPAMRQAAASVRFQQHAQERLTAANSPAKVRFVGADNSIPSIEENAQPHEEHPPFDNEKQDNEILVKV